nr:XRE family transcriptional regulator [Gordonibacter massiliensis (ex Traore et al. 2017)]
MNPTAKRKRRKRRVKEPLTDELLQELLDAPDPKTFADSHRIKERSLSGYLQQLLDEKGLERAEVVRKAGLNETFGYQIFMGQRGASRNKVLQLVFAMGLSLKEADRLLQAAGANELYCKSRRDAIIIFCLDRGYGLQKTDEELYRFGEDTIC